jgi:hypothetical protein
VESGATDAILRMTNWVVVSLAPLDEHRELQGKDLEVTSRVGGAVSDGSTRRETAPSTERSDRTSLPIVASQLSKR